MRIIPNFKRPGLAEARRVAWSSVAIVVVIMAIARVVILSPQLAEVSLFQAASLIFRGMAPDLIAALVYAAFAMGLVRLLPSRRLALAVILMLGMVLSAFAIGNITAVRFLGGPVTRDWLIFSDVLNSSYIVDVLISTLGPTHILIGLTGSLAFVLLSFCLARLPEFIPRPLQAAIVSGAAPVIAVLALIELAASGTGLQGRAQNPVFALAASMLFPTQLPAVGLPENTASLDDVALPTSVAMVPGLTKPDTAAGRIRNVLFIVLESARADHVPAYETRTDITPVMNSLVPSSLIFDRAYAQVPASGYAMLSLFGAVTPEVSPYSVLDHYPDIWFQGLPRTLGESGYRTGFFASLDTSFQDTAKLAGRVGFDTVKDLHDWPCAEPLSKTAGLENSYQTANDLCVVPPLLAWIDEAPDNPFFAAVWTGMTHYPYYDGSDPVAYDENPEHTRYLNGLRTVDEALGLVLTGLADRGHLDDTLIVLVGDHGEAFGEHGQQSHPSQIYEENLRIPLLFVNKGLFAGSHSDLITRQIDIAPTVLDLLGVPAPAQWHGTSLFATQRQDAVFAFTAWNGVQIGFRSGDRKVVLNTTTDQLRVHDLKSDPNELDNLASNDPAIAEAARADLSLWLRHQDVEFRRLIATSAQGQSVARAVPPEGILRIRASGTRFGAAPSIQIALDGEPVGAVTITQAVSNDENEVPIATVYDQLTDYDISLSASPCSKELEFVFDQDSWAGEGKTGDTNVMIRSIGFGPELYYPLQMEPLIDEGWSIENGALMLWNNNRVSIHLTPPASCLVADLEAQASP